MATAIFPLNSLSGQKAEVLNTVQYHKRNWNVLSKWSQVQIQGTEQAERAHICWFLSQENEMKILSKWTYLYHVIPCILFLYHMSCLHGFVLQFFQLYLSLQEEHQQQKVDPERHTEQVNCVTFGLEHSLVSFTCFIRINYNSCSIDHLKQIHHFEIYFRNTSTKKKTQTDSGLLPFQHFWYTSWSPSPSAYHWLLP